MNQNLTPSLIKDIRPGAASSGIKNLTSFNGDLAFLANNGEGSSLFQSDGTTDGTVAIYATEVLSEEFLSGGINSSTTSADNNLFITDGVGANQFSRVFLTATDGTESRISILQRFEPGESSSVIGEIVNVNGTPFLNTAQVNDSIGSKNAFDRLWKSDGTEAGTTSVTVITDDIIPGRGSSIQNLTDINNTWFFSADDGVNGRELWGLTEADTNKDLIIGGNSNDILVGSDRDNIIDGLQGDDTLTGGGGKDKFVLSADFGNDLITDFTLGEDEIINATDKIVLTVGLDGDALKVAFSNTGDVLQVNLNGNEQAELENYLLNIGSEQNLPL